MRILRTPHRALPSVPIRQADRLPTTNGLYYVVDGWHLLYICCTSARPQGSADPAVTQSAADYCDEMVPDANP